MQELKQIKQTPGFSVFVPPGNR